MGDRIAILQEGGELAQYATPGGAAHARPPTSSSRTSSAPTARSSASRCSACATSTCGRSTTACPSRSCRDEARRDPVRVASALGERHPVRTVRERRVPARRARATLLREPGRSSARVDRRPRVASQGVLGVDCRSTSCWRSDGRGARRERSTLLAQAGSDFFRDRSSSADSCVENNGFCPDWIVRQPRPLRVRRCLAASCSWSSSRSAIGFAIAFALALVAHRRRWLVGPITQVTGDPLHDPQRRAVLPAAADHRARQHDGDHRARPPTRC